MNLWSSKLATYLSVVGAAVGLGSIWRFPYLAGTGGGFAFIAVFVVAILAIATPLLVAEFAIGRWSRESPPAAAGAIALAHGGGPRARRWNAIGWLGSLAAFLIVTYYTMIAGWVLAYTVKCASGRLSGMSHTAVSAEFRALVGDPVVVAAWHLLFVALVAAISAAGVSKGIETAGKVRAPAFLALLLVLVAYALAKGDVARGLTFAFSPDWSKLTPAVVLAAVGQAFYATGVGMAMMLAYGAYIPKGVSLLRSALAITGAIVLVSLLATLIVFPLVFRYGMDPAQGAALVFDVLPAAFAEMPGGRLVGTLFFVLLAFAALTPSIAAIEPVVVWLERRHGVRRRVAVIGTAAAAWIVGLGSVFSFNLWAEWHPLAVMGGVAPRLGKMTFFDLMDFLSSNLLLPVGALLTCAFLGWRFRSAIPDEELEALSPFARRAVLFSIRWLSPVAIAAVLIAALR